MVSSASTSVLVSYLGGVVRHLGDWMPIGATVSLLALVDLDDASVRNAVFRLKKRQWLVPERRSGVAGYRITELALSSFVEGDTVVWKPREPAELADGWCIVNFSVPEADRARRHQLRSRLAAIGFGNIGSAVWIAPARMVAQAEAVIAQLGLRSMATVFVGRFSREQDPTAVLGGWNLPEINDRYLRFIEAREAAVSLRGRSPLSPEQAFVAFVTVLDEWRPLPFRDPGLPREMLGADWSGERAGRLFVELVGELEQPALEYALTFWPSDTELTALPATARI